MTVHIALLLVSGLAILATTTLVWMLDRLYLSLPFLYLGAGVALALLPVGLPDLDPIGSAVDASIVQYATELIVIVSIGGAALRIDRPFGWRSWRPAWRLLGVAMTLTMLGVTATGVGLLGLPLAAAVLLAGILAPTDPVLAESVSVGPPNTSSGAGDDVRFGLTAEAGLNDGLAFPFVHLGMAGLAAGSLGGVWANWAAVDLAWRVTAGVGVGFGLSRVIGWYRRRSGEGEGDQTNAGVFAFGSVLVAYAAAEAIGGYGFVAVFFTFLFGRQHDDPGHDHHLRTHDFLDQVERILMAVLLLGAGAILADGVWRLVTVRVVLVAVLLVVVIRPLSGLAAFAGSSMPGRERLAIAFFGIRGLGSIYYLAYATTHIDLGPHAGTLWVSTVVAVLVSVALHGLSATRLLRHLVGEHTDRIAAVDGSAPTPGA